MQIGEWPLSAEHSQFLYARFWPVASTNGRFPSGKAAIQREFNTAIWPKPGNAPS